MKPFREEGVHQCIEPFRCLNRIGSYVCSCPYKVYRLEDGILVCREETTTGIDSLGALLKNTATAIENCTDTDGTQKTCNPKDKGEFCDNIVSTKILSFIKS